MASSLVHPPPPPPSHPLSHLLMRRCGARWVDPPHHILANSFMHAAASFCTLCISSSAVKRVGPFRAPAHEQIDSYLRYSVSIRY